MRAAPPASEVAADTTLARREEVWARCHHSCVDSARGLARSTHHQAEVVAHHHDREDLRRRKREPRAVLPRTREGRAHACFGVRRRVVHRALRLALGTLSVRAVPRRGPASCTVAIASRAPPVVPADSPARRGRTQACAEVGFQALFAGAAAFFAGAAVFAAPLLVETFLGLSASASSAARSVRSQVKLFSFRPK